jgi:hypothetical protein
MTLTTIDQYNALVGLTLSRGKVQNQPIGAAATLTMDAPVGGSDFVTLEVDMTGGAAGDLAVTCLPYEADGVTIMPAPLQPVLNVGTTAAAPTVVFSGGHCYQVIEYNVQGIDKVQFQIKNNNVAAQTITRASWRVESF